MVIPVVMKRLTESTLIQSTTWRPAVLGDLCRFIFLHPLHSWLPVTIYVDHNFGSSRGVSTCTDDLFRVSYLGPDYHHLWESHSCTLVNHAVSKFGGPTVGIDSI